MISKWNVHCGKNVMEVQIIKQIYTEDVFIVPQYKQNKFMSSESTNISKLNYKNQKLKENWSDKIVNKNSTTIRKSQMLAIYWKAQL